MKVEWDGRVGPATITNLVTFLAIVIGGAVAWTQMQDKQIATDTKVDGIRTAVISLRTDLKNSQAERTDQGQRLSRVETAITFLTSYFRGPTTFDHGSMPPPQLPPN